SLSLSVLGGTSFLWTGPNGFTATSPSIFIPNVTTANSGLYSVTVSGTGNCETSAARDVFVELVEAQPTSNSPVCSGGSLELQAPDGADSYTWTGPNGFSSNEQNPVIPNVSDAEGGIYTLEIVKNGCRDQATTSVQIVPPFAITINANGPLCYGETILLSASGGTSYQWEGPAGFSSTEKNPSIPDAVTGMSGTYSVTVTDGQGCEAFGSVDVSVGEKISVDYTPSHVTCDVLGSIQIGLRGGLMPYSFDWADLTGNNDPQDRDNLNAGVYSVTITDAGGCSVEINAIPILDNCEDCSALAGTLSEINDQVCFENGTAQIGASYNDDSSVPAGYVVRYVLTQAPNETILAHGENPSFTVDTTGTYTIHVLVLDTTTLDMSRIDLGSTSLFDLNSWLIQGGGTICAGLDLIGQTIEVVQPQAEVVATMPDNCDLAVGRAELSPANYIYNWSDGGSGAVRTDLRNATYTITVVDPSTSCESTLEVSIGGGCICITPELDSIDIESATCGNANGSIKIVVDNPANYQYSWSANANVGTANSFGNERYSLPAGVYTVTITFPNAPDCSIERTISIGNIDGPVVDSVIVVPAVCGMANGSVSILPTDYVYLWSHDNFNGSSRNDLTAGIYHVVVVNPLAPQCPNIVTLEVEKNNPLVAEAMVVRSPDCKASNGEIQISVSVGDTSDYNYEWNDDATINMAYRTGLPAGIYNVNITPKDPTGCETELTFVLEEVMGGASLDVVPMVSTTCYGNNDGRADYNLQTDAGFV
ncbi:MAG: hypothetical protein AAFV25_24730, partial [Bacteroidota bacterium]